MLHPLCRRPILYPKGIISIIYERTSVSPKFHALPFSLKFCTSTSDPHSFRVSYLMNYLGFSPETALKASKQLRFETSEKPDSVFTFFRNHGFSDSQIKSVIRRLPQLLAFDPHKTLLPKLALKAKRTLPKHLWDAKVDNFKRWGWSEEAILDAFRRQPNIFLSSIDKINAVISFWVNQLDWNSLVLARHPSILLRSLEKRIIPRAFVLQYLLAKGLRNKNASLYSPFAVPEMMFLRKYVECFKEEHSLLLLKLYQEKMNFQDKSGNGGM